jgi:phosphoribosylformimino-5-aminoimidazole carboxamide ribotide isomerase
MDWAKKQGMKKVWCNARASATALYEKFGLKPSGPGWEKYGIGFIKMEKQLL